MNDMRNSLIIAVILLTVLKEHIFSDAVLVRWTNAVCGSHNNNTFVVHTCRLRAVERNKTVLNYNATLLQPAYSLSARIRVVKKANGYKPWLFDVNCDVCEFLRKHNNPFVSLVYNVFKDFSNLNHTCPYVGPILLIGGYLRPELIGLPMPTGDYGVLIDWTFNRKARAYTYFYFEFIEDL